jgi:hypothetical protein
MGQKKNLFTPDQILYQGSSHRPASPQPPTDPPRRPDLWPVFLFLFFLTLIAVLAWVGQMGH